MKPQTLNDIFFAIVEHKERPVMLARKADQWVPVSSNSPQTMALLLPP